MANSSSGLASKARSFLPTLGWNPAHRHEWLLPDVCRVALWEWQHLYCSQPAFRCGEKVRRPCVECSAFLLCPTVPLINPNHASAASAQMIKHRLGDFETHAEPLQPCRKRPAQVVQPPAGNTGCCVERRLRFRPAAKGRSALARENERQLRALVSALDIAWPVDERACRTLSLVT